MGKVIDLVGQRFGRLTVLAFEKLKVFPSGKRCAVWRCKCDCGAVVCAKADALKQGHTTGCGCRQKEQLAERARRLGKMRTVHGMEGTQIYHVWRGMKNRCCNPNSEKYKNYGARGIKVCDEWKDDFQAFFDYVSKLEPFGEEGFSLDRIDVNGDYAPGNVKWSTAKEQARNRRNNLLVEYNGRIMTVAQAAQESGIRASVLYGRIRRYGIDYEKLFMPSRQSSL